jgi:hypothetical protein
MASLKCCWAAAAISSRSRPLLSGVSFQLTMNPSIPADLACRICSRITLRSLLE